jgi:hypothetical protein
VRPAGIHVRPARWNELSGLRAFSGAVNGDILHFFR